MIRYYAWTKRDGKHRQVLVTVDAGKIVSQEETGTTYKSIREAAGETERLNCGE